MKIIKTFLKKSKALSRNCKVKINFWNMKTILGTWWSIIKEVIRKKKVISCFPNKLILDNKEITDTSIIAEKFNNYFAAIGPKLASKIPQTSKHHSQYINAATPSLQQIKISEEEFKTAYLSLKRNKSSGYNDISANVVRNVYNKIQKPFFYIFQRSFH